MSGKETAHAHICRGLAWGCGIGLLLLLVPVKSPAAEPASGLPEERKSQQSSKQSQVPPRLAPLGLEKLMDMEVTTVTRTEGTVGESAAAVHVITQEDIRRSGATMIPEVLRRVPGVNVARIDNNKWAISARGFAERFFGKMLVQIDGRTLYNPFTSGVYWDAVDYPLEDIERIEVIRGPRAGVWGANAVNGIINIITRSSKDTLGGLITAGGGSPETGFGTVRYGGNAGGAGSYRVYAKGFDRAEQYSRNADPHDAWSGISGGFRADWHPGDRDLLTLEGNYLHSDADRHDFRAQPAPPFSFENFETESTDNPNLLARWTHIIREDSKWSLQVYWDGFHRYLDQLRLRFRWDTYDVDFQHQFPMGRRQKILWGAGYRLVDSFLSNSGRDDGFVFHLTENRHDNQTFSLYGQYELTVVDNILKVLLNSRFEHNDFTGFEVQPSAQILYTPTKRQSVWASVARAVRTPNLNEFYAEPRLLPSSTVPPSFPEQMANPDFRAEEVLAYQLGYRVQPAGDLSFDLALFYNVYDDLVTGRRGSPHPGPSGNDIPIVPVNGLEGETYGAELAATWQATEWWKVYAAYSYLQIFLHRKNPGLPASAEAAEGQSPENQVYVQSSFDLPHHVELDLIGRWVDRLTGFNASGSPGTANDIPSYFALDVRVGWRALANLELAVVGQNLLDRHHPEFGTSPLVRSPLVEIRRGVYGKATWRF